MKKLTTISFLVIFLCANTEIHQLLKLPSLIHHFLEHKVEEPNASIIAFLRDHYMEGHSQSSKDKKEHEKLPFKTADCTTAHTLLAFDSQKTYSFRPTNTFSVQVKVVYNEIIYSAAILNKIWQPPQIS